MPRRTWCVAQRSRRGRRARRLLAALRAAITLQEPYGLPGEVRVDRGKDFLSKTVASVLAGFAVKVEDLPGYTPHLKGSVETVNGAAGQVENYPS